MLELDRALVARLQGFRVRIEVPDRNTIVLRDVPADGRFFNKPRTSLLVKRPGTGMPFITFVDADLEYHGPDTAVARAFRGGIRREGWRTLCVGVHLKTDLHEATAGILAALGFDGRTPAVASPERPGTAGLPRGMLASAGTNLSQLVRDAKAEPTVGREDEIEELASCVLRWGQARLAVVVGESGVGKTNLLYAVAARLSSCRPDLNVMLLDLAALFAGSLLDAERENTLSTILGEVSASADTVLALEHFERALSVPCGSHLITKAADAGARIIGTILPPKASALDVPPLERRVYVVELGELAATETVSVLRVVRGPIGRHHRIEIDESCLGACVQAARSLPGAFPAKAIALLDAAGARAALSGATVIGPDDIYFAAGQSSGGSAAGMMQ